MSSKDGSNSKSNQIFKEKAKNRVDELHGMVQNLLHNNNDNNNKAVTEISQKLKEWKAELEEPSPASSHNDGSLGSFSSDLIRYLVEDDASSALSFLNNPTDTNTTQSIQVGDSLYFDEIQDYLVNPAPSEQEFHAGDQFKDSFSVQHTVASNADIYSQFDHHQYNPHLHIDQNILSESDRTSPCIGSVGDQSSSVMCARDPLSSFVATKCALWDCVRPATGMEGCQDYCDQFHADLAKKEGPPGSSPFMQHGGISVNDDVLFAALIAKIRGRDVGIPECAGAATATSLLKSSERFNLVLGDERVREWLFFDTPRRGSEIKDKKKKSFPDHSGRGWHISRTLKMAEFDGSKKSYYMDPQPLYNLELHLYVYEVNNCNECALYRVELKVADEKKSPKGKTSDKSPVDLQKQTGQYPAEHLGDGSPFVREDNSYITQTGYELGAQYQGPASKASFCYGDSFLNLSPHKDGSPSFDGSVNNLEVSNQLDYPQFDLHQEGQSNRFIVECALWDCSRPAQGSHYCSMFHCNLAYSEGPLSMHPVIRSRGISLKDGPLFSSLGAKLQGKEVGIPECEGAATMKSPWNDPERFNTYLFEGEMIREWLFFDKPRKAFESGNRNKRSLPDYIGRGWHSSRKQEMKEYGGVKKSYYMDPQPSNNVEWHLYEYVSEASESDKLILYRLALKKGKKSPKGKTAKDPIVDLQNQMGRLNAEFPSDNDETTADSKYDYQVQSFS